MPKLSDAIQAARRHGGRQLGFGVASANARPKRGLLIAAVGGAATADILVVADPAAVAATVESAGDAVVGIAPQSLTAQNAAAAAESGAAFAVFSPQNTSADALLRDDLEYVVRVPFAADEGELRAIGSLRPAVVAVDRLSEPLPVTEMLALRRVVMLSGAPAGARIDAGASTTHLQSLRDSGVAVLVLSDPSEAEIESLRARIAELPEASRKRRGEAGPLVPGIVPSDDDDFDDEL